QPRASPAERRSCQGWERPDRRRVQARPLPEELFIHHHDAPGLTRLLELRVSPERAAARRPARASTVGLVMIVKNEEHVLPRLADSVRNQIDHWTIVDTGSNDRTIETARQAFAGTPGEIVEDIWRGYGQSRNVAIEHAEEHTDWL